MGGVRRQIPSCGHLSADVSMILRCEKRGCARKEFLVLERDMTLVKRSQRFKISLQRTSLLRADAFGFEPFDEHTVDGGVQFLSVSVFRLELFRFSEELFCRRIVEFTQARQERFLLVGGVLGRRVPEISQRRLNGGLGLGSEWTIAGAIDHPLKDRQKVLDPPVAVHHELERLVESRLALAPDLDRHQATPDPLRSASSLIALGKRMLFSLWTCVCMSSSKLRSASSMAR